MDDNIKKAMLVSVLQGCALKWYIKYSNDHLNVGIMEIQIALNREFNRPKSKTLSIIGFKEITMLPSETPWDLDQRLKGIVREANMTLTNAHHHSWFVVLLSPHLRIVLSQQKLTTQAEALEMVMILHETLIQDPTLGVQQIHTQLHNLCLEMKSLKQERAL